MSRDVTPRTRNSTPRESNNLTPTSAHGAVLLNGVKNLDSQLKELRRQHGGQPFDVQESMRASLTKYCCELIADEPELAVAHDIEYILWKACFYRKIEDHRAAMRKASRNQKASPSSAQEKVRKSLHGFLVQTKAFYESMLLQYLDVAKMQLVDQRFVDSWDGTDYSIRRTMYLALLTAHRCLVFLGDIERYFQLCVKAPSSASSPRPHVELARRYYHLALELVPENGNPYNQLAVLATANNEDLLAVYHYFRSLCVDQPFETARQNLTLVFTKNEQIVSKHFLDEDGNARQQSSRRGARAFLDAMLTRLFAILYSNDVDMFVHFEQMLAMLRPRLAALLCDESTSADEREAYVMRVVVCSMFTVHTYARHLDGDVDTQRFVSSPSLPSLNNPTAVTNTDASAAADFNSARCRLAVTWLFELAAILVREVNSVDSRWLAGVGVLCDWLSLHSHFLKQHVPSTVDERYIRLEANARQMWWHALVRVLNQFPEQVVVLTTDPSPQPLLEELDLRNFVHINHTYRQYGADFLARRDPSNPQAKHSPRTPSKSVMPALSVHSSFSKRWYKIHLFVRDQATIKAGLIEKLSSTQWAVARRPSTEALLATDIEGGGGGGVGLGVSYHRPTLSQQQPLQSFMSTFQQRQHQHPQQQQQQHVPRASTSVSFLGQDSIWGAPEGADNSNNNNGSDDSFSGRDQTSSGDLRWSSSTDSLNATTTATSTITTGNNNNVMFSPSMLANTTFDQYGRAVQQPPPTTTTTRATGWPQHSTIWSRQPHQQQQQVLRQPSSAHGSSDDSVVEPAWLSDPNTFNFLQDADEHK